MQVPPGSVRLRDVEVGDLAVFFEQQRGLEANRMAAFAMENPEDRDAFLAHWNKVLADRSNKNQAILFHGRVAGYVACFELLGKLSVAYWLGGEFWGQGVATEGLRQFLRTLPERPLYARAAWDNHASIRVLQKAGFVRDGKEMSYANARKVEIEELIYRLDAA